MTEIAPRLQPNSGRQLEGIRNMIRKASRFGSVIAAAIISHAAAAQQTVCPGAVVPFDASAGSSPFVYMRLASREGWFLIDTGATYSSVDARSFGLRPGSKASLSGSSLPTVSGGEFVVKDLSRSKAPGVHFGTIGTDFLSRRTVEFRYDTDTPYLAISEQRCVPRHFEDAGFISIAQQGYYSSRPQDHARMQNIPVIFARIGDVTAPIWVDSGYRHGDGSKHAIVHINQSFAQKLRLSGVRMDSLGTGGNTDCNGRHTDDQLWQVQDTSLMFIGRDGQALFRYGPPTLQVRQPSSCGTIAEREEAFGMVGALYLRRWGTVVFDGPSERMWVTRKRVASRESAYRAMAVAWNKSGGFTATNDDSFDQATARALSVCNEKNKDCTMAGSINGLSFSCLAVTRNLQQTTKLSYASRGSLDEARGAALEHCAKVYGSSCKVEHSGCND